MIAILRRPAFVSGIAISAFAGASALWLRSTLAPPPAQLAELFHYPLLLVGVLAIMGGLALWALVVLLLGPTAHRLWAVLVVFSLVAAVAWIRIHTDFGLFALGGSRYWLDKASASDNELQRQQHLGRVLSATQYGANIAEGVVSGYPPRERAILFASLANATDSPRWRQRYLELAEQARRDSGLLPVPTPGRASSPPR